MRQKELGELGASGWTKLNAAIQKGNKSETLRLANELKDKTKKLLDIELDLIDLLFLTLANRLGEEVVYQVLRTFNDRYLKHQRKKLFEGVDASAEERIGALADALTMSHATS